MSCPSETLRCKDMVDPTLRNRGLLPFVTTPSRCGVSSRHCWISTKQAILPCTRLT